MPLNLNDAMLNELVQREIAKEDRAARFAPRPEPNGSIPVTPLNPALASVGGAALDAISTYRFLKNGTGTEGNALYAHGSPLSTAAIGAATGPLVYLLLKQTAPALAKLWGAQVGAHQLGLGALNFDASNDRSSFDKLNQKLDPTTPRR